MPSCRLVLSLPGGRSFILKTGRDGTTQRHQMDGVAPGTRLGDLVQTQRPGGSPGGEDPGSCGVLTNVGMRKKHLPKKTMNALLTENDDCTNFVYTIWVEGISLVEIQGAKPSKSGEHSQNSEHYNEVSTRELKRANGNSLI